MPRSQPSSPSQRPKAASARVSRPGMVGAGLALTDALHAAAWAEADLHLARAWREAEGVEADLAAALAALTRREKDQPRPSAARRRLAAAIDRAAFAAERIAAAARVRRLERGSVGVEPFDPARHALGPDVPAPAAGAPVMVHAPAILRRTGTGDDILIRALAAPAPRAGSKRRTRTSRA